MAKTQSPRVLIFSGKGGTGKTTMAAATGLRCAEAGHRTIVISVDVAHSLGDAYDVTAALLAHPRGTPYTVRPGLDIQEIDVQEEVDRHWPEVFGYFSVLFAQTGLDQVMAEELALIPGMEDVIALLYLNEYLQDGTYDTIILDLAPTGESLRFVSMPNTLDWYMRHLFRVERNILKVARPIAKRLSEVPLPDDHYFEEIERLWRRLEGVDKVLLDADTTTVRLVTNPEKMVLTETERAHLYFSLYGVVVDGVIINRSLDAHPAEGLPPQFSAWIKTHRAHIQRAHDVFDPIPITTVPLMHDEVVGLDRLRQVAEALYGTGTEARDPRARQAAASPVRFVGDGDTTTLEVHLPNLDPAHLQVHREAEEIILRIGSQKRHILLPRRLRGVRPSETRYRDGVLRIRFEAASDTATTDAASTSAQR